MEISLFGLIGDMIYVNYGTLDANLDGTISTTETNNYSALQKGAMDNGTATTLKSDNYTWEDGTVTIYKPGKAYIEDSKSAHYGKNLGDITLKALIVGIGAEGIKFTTSPKN